MALYDRRMKSRADEKLESDIQHYGWHCLHVAPRLGKEGASFTYTIGLVSSYHHPELMIFGLGRDKSHGILCECVEMIKAGTKFPVNERVSDVLSRDFDVMFKPIRKEFFSEYLGTAVRHYGHKEFGAYVLFWPDKANQFAWESPELSSQSEALHVV
jgi:hypothetical protein